MERTFEELIGPEIDALFEGALFLAAGRRDEAERLLLETVARCFRAYRDAAPAEDFGRWIEGGLARTFLDEGPGHEPAEPRPAPARAARGRPADPRGLRDLAAADLHRAAGAVPARVRPALWLVFLRRRGYAEAAEALGVGPDRLRRDLAFRADLLDALVGGGREVGSGPAGGRAEPGSGAGR